MAAVYRPRRELQKVAHPAVPRTVLHLANARLAAPPRAAQRPKNKRAIGYRNGSNWELIDAREFQTREEALAYEARVKRAPPQTCPHKLAWVQENAERIKEIVTRERFRFPKELQPPDAQRYRT
jgi:hypothetical protein